MARKTDPETSHIAAELVDAARLEGLVLDAIRECRLDFNPHGMHCDEIWRAVRMMNPGEDIPLQSITPRIAPLKRKGLIVVVGRRLGDKGRPRDVLDLAEFHSEVAV